MIGEIETAAQYLATVHITKLSTAARMAGLRFKNGAPGYDKAGIIEKLKFSPSILRATLATIQRMEKGENLNTPSPVNGPNPFADDIAEEQNQPMPAPPAPIIPQANPASSDALDRALRAIGGLANRISTVEREKCGSDQVGSIVRIGVAPVTRTVEGLTSAIEALKAKIIELEKQAPIQINIKDRPVIDIGPGQHEAFPRLIQYLQINRRVILTGSAGTGKSMAVKNAAEKLGVKFYLQTPVTMSHELIGHRDAAGVFHETPLFQAYTRGGLILMDESDASLPDALLVANPIFDGNGFAMFGDGKLHAQHPDFLAVFNMNTDGNGATMQYAGRNRLDGATLARFGVRIHWGIDPRIEASMALGCDSWLAAIRAVRKLMDDRQIMDVNATPRHLKTGALLLTQTDIPRAVILSDVLKSGALVECWKDVENLPSVRAFLQGA